MAYQYADRSNSLALNSLIISSFRQVHLTKTNSQTSGIIAYSTPWQLQVDIDALLQQRPVIPHAVPTVFIGKNMKTLEQSLSNRIPGNRNVYICGLHPNTDDATLAAYAARFGQVEASKAIIDIPMGVCKGFDLPLSI